LKSGGGSNLFDSFKGSTVSDIFHSKRIFIITDGYYGIANDVIFRVMKNIVSTHSDTRLFLLGVGYIPNDAMIQRLAQTSSTIAEHIYPDENPETKVLLQMKRALYPLLNAELYWKNIDEWPLTVNRFPTLFDGSRLVLYALWGSTVTIDMIKAASLEIKISNSQTFPTLYETIEIPLNDSAVEVQSLLIHQLSAKSIIRDLETREYLLQEDHKNSIIYLGESFSLSSKYTSFIALESRLNISTPVNDTKSSNDEFKDGVFSTMSDSENVAYRDSYAVFYSSGMKSAIFSSSVIMIFFCMYI
jgi:hypothetical protein